MPVQLTPRPQPGDLITAEWMNRLADAIAELQGQVEALDARLDKLEKPKVVGPGIKVPWDPSKFGDFFATLDDVRRKDDPRERLVETIKRYNDVRAEVGGGELRGELSDAEILNLFPAAGLSPTEGVETLKTIDPIASSSLTRTVEASGSRFLSLDLKTDLSKGTIGGLIGR